MILYVDTSALVKLYVAEAGTLAVRKAVSEAEAVATVSLAYAEMRAAFARMLRLRRIDVDGLARAKRAFESDFKRLLRIAADEPLVRRAGDLAEELRLRGYDALHLAAAERLRAEARRAFGFACFDDDLARAAATLGFGLLR